MDAVYNCSAWSGNGPIYGHTIIHLGTIYDRGAGKNIADANKIFLTNIVDPIPIILSLVGRSLFMLRAC